MILPKSSYVIVFLWLVSRGIQINKESKLHLFYATKEVLGPPCVYKTRRWKCVEGVRNFTFCNLGPCHKLSNINIAHLNIRSLKNREHYTLAKDIFVKNKLYVFTVSETWLDSTVSDVEVEIPGFKIHRLDRETKTGGGICTLLRKSLKLSVYRTYPILRKWITYAMVENPNKKLEIFFDLHHLQATERQP